MNTASDGSRPGGPYELDILSGAGVQGCYIKGHTDDLRGTVNAETNVIDAPNPHFDRSFRPRNRSYSAVGYRPVDELGFADRLRSILRPKTRRRKRWPPCHLPAAGFASAQARHTSAPRRTIHAL